jgi:hypothetical protein
VIADDFVQMAMWPTVVGVTITSITTVIVALISRGNRKAVNVATTKVEETSSKVEDTKQLVVESSDKASTDHLLVVDALRSLDERVGQVYEMVWKHITDSSAHTHPGWWLQSPPRPAAERTTQRSTAVVREPERLSEPPILKPHV